MKAYLVIRFYSGIGDTYSTLLSAYETFLYLESMGYDTTLTVDMRRNVYFPPDTPLDILFDMSIFKGKVLYNIPLNAHGGPDPLLLDSVRRLPQNQQSFDIFVSEVSPELELYQSYIYGHTELTHYPRRPECKTDLLSPDVIKIANEFNLDRDNLIGIHYRPLDMHGDVDSLFEDQKNNLDIFMKTVSDKTVLVSSNGNLIRNYMKAKYPNVFTVDFTHKNLLFFPPYDRSLASTEDFIRHAQEITAEMYLYHYCQRIRSISIFQSNFMTYGILNNLHHKDYHDLMTR